jgi:hypothetical protein
VLSFGQRIFRYRLNIFAPMIATFRLASANRNSVIDCAIALNISGDMIL